MCRFLLFVLLVASIACSGCAGTYEPASSVRVYRSSKSHYVLVDTATGRRIPERDFARMYKARTGSTELDGTDHAHVNETVAGMSVAGTMLAGSALLGALGIPHCEDEKNRCAAATYGTVLLGLVGSIIAVAVAADGIHGNPTEHDVPRERAVQLVDEYNRAPPIGPPAAPNQGVSMTTLP